MTFKYRYKKQIIIGSFILFTLLSIGGFLVKESFKQKKNEKKTSMTISKKKTTSSLFKKEKVTYEEEVSEIYVDIKGEVSYPGTYQVKSTCRVKDVIEMAGGLTGNADTSVINLSKKLEDEMVIIIYSIKEVQNFKETKEKEQLSLDACKYSENYGLENDACIDTKTTTKSSTDTTGVVNLNTASKEELMTLSGIGEAKADDIINYRNTNGGFKDIEEIKNIKGIGDSIFDKIKNRLTV